VCGEEGKGSGWGQVTRVLSVQANPRAIAPSPTRVLGHIPRAFLGRPPSVTKVQMSERGRLNKQPEKRGSGPPNSSRVLRPIPHARGGAKASR